MRILFIDKTHPHLEALLEDDGHILRFMLTESADEVKRALGEFEGLVCKSRLRLDGNVLESGANLKFIARAGVGVDHIDMGKAKELGIRVLTSAEGSRDTVAEHTLGLILGVMNNLMRADREIRDGKWLRKENTGNEIKGKTIGILGYGNMGQAVAQRLRGFNCRVICWDKFKDRYGDEYAQQVELEEFFQQTDILSIHIFYIPENHYFIDSEFLNRFHKSIWLANTSRGLVLETGALVDLLKSGKVLGAALDVIEYEEFSFDGLEPDQLPEDFQYLRTAPNVVLSPHIAGWSEESLEAHARVLHQKIKDLTLGVGTEIKNE